MRGIIAALAALGFLVGGLPALASCPSTATDCPSPTFNNLTVGGTASTGNIVGSGGLLQLNNGTSNFLTWADVGIGAPTFTAQSVGTKLVLYQAIDASDVDFGFGIASGTLWASVPQANGTYQFAWYGGTTKLASLSGTGAFSATSYLAGATVGVTCAGSPTVSFASTNGIVTHC